MKLMLRLVPHSMQSRRILVVLAFLFLSSAMGMTAWKAMSGNDIKISAAGFYTARVLRQAHTDAVALDRVLDIAAELKASPQTLTALARTADQFYVRFMGLRKAASRPPTEGMDVLFDLADRVQDRLDAVVGRSAFTHEEVIELSALNESLVRGLSDYIRDVESATDEALAEREKDYAFNRQQVIASIALLSLLAMAVIILLERQQRSSRAVQESLLRDPLTGLSNRHGLAERFDMLEKRTKTSHALIVFDLDDFKPVNDTFGHAAGDQLLVAAAEWLRDGFGDGGIVARWGGDEFIAVLPASGSELDDRVKRIRSRLADTPRLVFDGRQVKVSFSCGVAVWPRDAETIAGALQKADFALYAAKEQGKGRLVVYEPAILADRIRVQSIRSSLVEAIDHGHLLLKWQPQIDLRSGKVVGAEALIRCKDPKTGTLIMPSEFIPVAESSDLILEIDRYVIEEACRAATVWSAEGAGAIRTSINLSPRKFLIPGLVDLLAAALTAHKLPANRLEIEITEGVLLEDNDTVHRNLVELSALGVRLALDDFGTGYSNISYLVTLKPDIIKIDRSFLGDDDHETRTKVIGGILGLARSIGAETIVEGVETAEQLAFLKAIGCPLGQGYFFARPMPASDILPWRDDFEGRTVHAMPMRRQNQVRQGRHSLHISKP